MTVLAVIPARGGSKGVPGKNLARVGGVPLVVRAVRESLAARRVTDVVVSTDDPDIAAAARDAGAGVVVRPAEIAGDTATSEAAVLHALDAFEESSGRRVGVVVLVQCTSPFLTRGDVDGVAAAVLDDGADTAVTVSPFHGFLWRPHPAGPSQPPAHPGPAAPSQPAEPPQPAAHPGPAEPSQPAAHPGPAGQAHPGPAEPSQPPAHPGPAGQPQLVAHPRPAAPSQPAEPPQPVRRLRTDPVPQDPAQCGPGSGASPRTPAPQSPEGLGGAAQW
ncbi:NTP transferase domain-containing protein, partial [Streptomyces sp. NPDC001985]|uniref:acylneuraminate cytidylyltransferase family protein n=1 Tax=Streptomyces sp. NPDC001985 TaxID=3154406 RepID=UPI00331BB9A4